VAGASESGLPTVEIHFQTDAKKYFRMLEDYFQQVRKYDMFLNYPALDLDRLYIRGYADASFGMNVDGSSLLYSAGLIRNDVRLIVLLRCAVVI
jgi:hypothetical protein